MREGRIEERKEIMREGRKVRQMEGRREEEIRKSEGRNKVI